MILLFLGQTGLCLMIAYQVIEYHHLRRQACCAEHRSLKMQQAAYDTAVISLLYRDTIRWH